MKCFIIEVFMYTEAHIYTCIHMIYVIYIRIHISFIYI